MNFDLGLRGSNFGSDAVFCQHLSTNLFDHVKQHYAISFFPCAMEHPKTEVWASWRERRRQAKRTTKVAPDNFDGTRKGTSK